MLARYLRLGADGGFGPMRGERFFSVHELVAD